MTTPTTTRSSQLFTSWMASEVRIDQIVRRFGGVAAYPELIAVFVQRGVGVYHSEGVNYIIEIIQSSNIDLCIEAVSFVLELTEIDVDMDDRLLTIGANLADQFTESALPQALAGLLYRLDQSKEEEKETVFKILGVFENLFELKPEAVDVAGQKTNLIKWILGQLISEEGATAVLESFNDNKLYASEILAILMQSPQNQVHFSALNLMPQLVFFLRTLQEMTQFPMDFKEAMLNLFNCLALALMNKSCQDEFAENEGIDVMLRLLK